MKTEDEKKQKQKPDFETKVLIACNLVILAFTVFFICVGIE